MDKIILITILLLLLIGDLYVFIIPSIKNNKLSIKGTISSILLVVALYLASL